MNGVSSVSDLAIWEDNFESETLLLADTEYEVWNLYQEGGLRPQYVVIDRELIIRFKGIDKTGFENAISIIKELWSNDLEETERVGDNE